jgi:hypothetical protein
MQIGRAMLLAFVVTAPFSVQLHEQGDTLATVTAADGTQFEVMAGTGTYAFLSRGCNGEILRRNPVSFRDAAVRVQVPLAGSGVALGVRAGVVRDDFAGGNGFVTEPIVVPSGPEPPRVISTNRYVNPYLSFDQPRGSVGLGYVWHEHEFPTAGEGARQQAAHPLNDLSAHVRIGDESSYFETRWMEGVPLYSDGGYLSVGGGGRPGGGPCTFFVGMGAGGPYEGAGLALRLGFDVGAGWKVDTRSRLGSSGGAKASGIAIGVNYVGRKH